MEAVRRSRTAIVDSEGTFSYADLDQASHRVASKLLGNKQDLAETRVAFLVTPSFTYAAVQRGIWIAGGIAVPLAISHPKAELEYVIQDAQADIVIVDPIFVSKVESLVTVVGFKLYMTSEVLADQGMPELPEVLDERRAMIVYTSGTTGRPKGVVTTHGNIKSQVGALVKAWEWNADDYILLILPLHHVHGIINGLASALAAGATCEFLPEFNARTVWKRLSSGEVTVFTAVPTIYHRLLTAWKDLPDDIKLTYSEGISHLRLMMSGSAALPVQMLEQWRQTTGHTLLERYGMTEIGMALSNPLHGVRRPGFVGTPLPDVEVQLVDEVGKLVSTGSGELEVKGPGVFLEYWQRPGETAKAFRNGWFRTGDMALNEDGRYRLLGRTSVDIIKTGGYKVSALEIEEVLRRHPTIEECAVVGIPDSQWGELICVGVELSQGGNLELETLQSWAQEYLAPYKVPRVLRCLQVLPRNAMGKVVKTDLIAMFESDSKSLG